MVELLFEFLFETLFHAALYLPGACISTLMGLPPRELEEGRVVALSLAFWGVVTMVGLVVWQAISSWSS